ncbi:predicted protein [Sclerotinia sclerotiorum 1980 UF-70]|uniref:Uncharacterized protein n=1 Tax=Sclerotinia sclerotiorum (strain ATCC 18683 / 1980 / Ss-1) TaxID=665079 RepID=A7ELH9_SCLS1|nr:predicted protein [Sclerotinia sclerotiorum 1980 UF-70]EDO03695.1 predicted protein [Sclerotinia sclerotiorum 1980 UF-70]
MENWKKDGVAGSRRVPSFPKIPKIPKIPSHAAKSQCTIAPKAQFSISEAPREPRAERYLCTEYCPIQCLDVLVITYNVIVLEKATDLFLL